MDLQTPLNQIETGVSSSKITRKQNTSCMNLNNLLICGLLLLLLNLIATIGLIVSFSTFAAGVMQVNQTLHHTMSDAIDDITSQLNHTLQNFGILPQVSKLIRTNLDLTTWRSFMEDASVTLDQVSQVDWSHEEKFTAYQYEDCSSNPQFSDKATCLAFVGDEKKNCQWYVVPDPDPGSGPCEPYDSSTRGCCWGTASKEYAPMQRSIAITEQDSQSAQTFIKSLKSAVDSAIAKLPSKDGKNMPPSSHPGVSNKTCASTRKPLNVESSLVNVPQFADTLLRDLDCLVAKVSDQSDSITLATVKAIYEGIMKISTYSGQRPNQNPHQEDNEVNTIMATVNMCKSLVDKYVDTISN